MSANAPSICMIFDGFGVKKRDQEFRQRPFDDGRMEYSGNCLLVKRKLVAKYAVTSRLECSLSA